MRRKYLNWDLCFKDAISLRYFPCFDKVLIFLKYLFKVMTCLWQSNYLLVFLNSSLNVSRILGQNLLSFPKDKQYCSPRLFRTLLSSNCIHAYSVISKDNYYCCSFSCRYNKTSKRHWKSKILFTISTINSFTEEK